MAAGTGPGHGAAMMIRLFDPAGDAGLLPGLAAMMVEAVAGGASISFMAGFSQPESLAWWQARSDAAAAGSLMILIASDGAGVAGTVSLVPATEPNQPHRADVAKMMVAQRARRHGVGAALLAAVEALALAHGRTTLVLDTISGSAAARLYERCGWRKVGDIPAYALLPDGAMAPTTYYCKILA
jgi:GNAT superfamily N-acetyltransferase